MAKISAPRFISSLSGKVRALTGERTLAIYAQKQGLSQDAAKTYLIQTYNDRVKEQRDTYYAEKRAAAAEKRRITRAAKTQAKQPALSKEDITFNKYDSQTIFRMLRPHLGKTVALIWKVEGRVLRVFRHQLPETQEEFRNFMTTAWMEWSETYDVTHMETVRMEMPGAEQSLELFLADKIPAKNIQQFFRSGLKHCVLGPIQRWAEANAASPDAHKRTKQRYTKIARDCAELAVEYENGVPSDKLVDICNKLRVDIQIDLPFLKNPYIVAKSNNKRLKLFRFVNSKLNHVSEGGIVQMQDPIIQTRDELIDLADQFDRDGVFYTYSKSNSGISRIDTLDASYGLENTYGDLVSEFEKSTGLVNCKLCDIKDQAVSRFIRAGVHYNSTVDFVPTRNIEVDDLQHCDMKAAYANFRKCAEFEGFLGKVTDFRVCSEMVDGPGIYKIKDISYTYCNKKFRWLMEHMNIYQNDGVYPSSDLRFLLKNKVYFRVTMGAYGDKVDFDFPEAFYEKYDGVRGYCRWTGACESHHLKKRLYMRCTDEYASVVSQATNGIVERYERDGYGYSEVVFSYPKTTNFHLSQVTSFITSYQRLCTLQQLMSMDPDSLVRVCVDGIYFRGSDDIPLYNSFRMKNDSKTLNNEAGTSYVSNSIYNKFEPGPKRPHFKHELHLGGGGSGKTHGILVDAGFTRVCYCAPSYKLVRAKAEEYGCSTRVVAQLLSQNQDETDKIRRFYNVLVIDEVSMIARADILLIKERYPTMKIVFCGDLNYQLGPVSGPASKEEDYDNVVHHNKDFRCKCPILSKLKDDLREMIRAGMPTRDINKIGMDQLPVVSVEQLKTMYSIDDYVICGTNGKKDHYTQMLGGTGTKEKYFVTENNRNYSNGQIVIADEKPAASCEIRHAYTAHSTQGESVSTKLFIDRTSMFDPRMLYTAVSRCRYFDQLYVIDNDYTPSMTGRIYQITNGTDVYIGSTSLSLDARLKGHISAKKAYDAGRGKRLTSFPLLDGGKISLIYEFECESLHALWEMEKQYIKARDCVNKTYK